VGLICKTRKGQPGKFKGTLCHEAGREGNIQGDRETLGFVAHAGPKRGKKKWGRDGPRNCVISKPGPRGTNRIRVPPRQGKNWACEDKKNARPKRNSAGGRVLVLRHRVRKTWGDQWCQPPPGGHNPQAPQGDGRLQLREQGPTGE